MGSEAPGAGIAALGLVTGLLMVLRGKGVISPQQAREIVDAALLGLEEHAPNVVEIVGARALLDGLLQNLVALDAEQRRPRSE